MLGSLLKFGINIDELLTGVKAELGKIATGLMLDSTPSEKRN
jgi:hypothetical protein